jgi:hypothetical protein
VWRERNRRQAHFDGISDISGQTAWQYLAARVRAQASGQNRYAVLVLASAEEYTWGLPWWSQELDNERWKRANAIFREHPFLTGYLFTRSALEHSIHPSPIILKAARLNFRGDLVMLASLWGGLLLTSAYALWPPDADDDRDDGPIDWRSLVVISAICVALTMSSGISFGAGSRLRAPLEAIVPLLAAVGVVRLVRRPRRLVR